ncbi:MAG: secondary thiamine-phosphate synthase enzyme YjbQ [Acidobacteriota bacterium]|nr:secondary thiamine-phosphate synthase enzyme YjbQ [Acidobacteriota bacterium]
MVHTVANDVETTGQGDIRDISASARQAVSDSGFSVGIVTVVVVGSTAGITTIEYEPGAVADFNRLLEQLAPRDGAYQHHERWGDDNGSSHVRAALIGPSLTVPFTHSTLQLGTWQQIVLVECDTRPRRRQVIVQIIGE